MIKTVRGTAIAFGLLAVTALAGACGEVRGDQPYQDGSGPGAVVGTPTAQPSPGPTGIMGTPVIPGTPGSSGTGTPIVDLAPTITVGLTEWEVTPDKSAAVGGHVRFAPHNAGTIPHEFVVIRTALPAGSLPVSGGKVDVSAAGNLVGEVEEDELEPGETFTKTFDMPAGQYVLICNLPGHYEAGMVAAFTTT